MTERTYDWNGHSDLPMGFAHLTDEQVAGEVRMLMRDQLNHEAICTMARDRIMALTKEKTKLQGEAGLFDWMTHHHLPLSIMREADGNWIVFECVKDTVLGSGESVLAALTAARKREHDLFKTGDPDAPENICDRNGEVCLGMCKKCGAVEFELEQPCGGKQ